MLVSMPPCCRASCAKNFALLGLMCARARKSSPCALTMAQNWRFLACWASFFAEEPLEGLCRANFFAEMWMEGPCWASFFAQSALRPGLVGDVAHEAGCRWGFCSIRNCRPACRRRVTPLMTPFPPIGDGETVMFDVCPAVSHAIPLWLFQDLNWHRWNCNDSGGC